MPSGGGRLPRGARVAGAAAHRAPGGRAARRAADARAPARVHARAPVGGRRAADGRGVVPQRRGSRSSRPTAAARSPTTARASSSGTRSCGSTTWWRTCGVWRARWSRLWPTRASPRGLGRMTGTGSPACGLASERSRRSGFTCSRGVSTHGFAVNVENDLEPFSWIVPCGLDGVQMTSLVAETGRSAGGMKCFRRRAAVAGGRGARAPATAGQPCAARDPGAGSSSLTRIRRRSSGRNFSWRQVVRMIFHPAAMSR